MSRAADGVACPPAIVAATALEADGNGGPQPLPARRRGASQPPAVIANAARGVDVVGGLHPFRARRRGVRALLPSSPTPPLMPTSSPALPPPGEAPCPVRPTAFHILLPLLPPPSLRPTSSPALTPSGRGVVARSGNGVAGPPTVVASAALAGDDIGGPHPLRERRRVARGQRRSRPSCRRRRRRPWGRCRTPPPQCPAGQSHSQTPRPEAHAALS